MILALAGGRGVSLSAESDQRGFPLWTSPTRRVAEVPMLKGMGTLRFSVGATAYVKGLSRHILTSVATLVAVFHVPLDNALCPAPCRRLSNYGEALNQLFGAAGGAGGNALQILTVSRTPAQTVLP
jgi:hypothetical protein